MWRRWQNLCKFYIEFNPKPAAIQQICSVNPQRTKSYLKYHDPWSRTREPQDKAPVQQLLRCGVCDVAEERSAGGQRALQAGQHAQSCGCIRSAHTHHSYSTPASSRRQREDRVLKARDRTAVVQRSIRTNLTKDGRTPEVHAWPRELKMYVLH